MILDHAELPSTSSKDSLIDVDTFSDEFVNDSVEYYGSILSDQELPRPSFYTLQILGMWQPNNANVLQHFYHKAVIPVIWIFSLVAIFGRCFIDYSNFRWGRMMNSFASIFLLGAPFLISHYYFHFGCYGELVTRIILEDRRAYKEIKKLSKYYSLVSLCMWASAFTFFYVHYQSAFIHIYYTVIYTAVLLLMTGWWAVWISVYGFICSLHKLQIQLYLQFMKEKYGYSARTVTAEENCIRDLIRKFMIIKNCLEQSQIDLGKIISFSVTYYIMDSVVFSIAYWKHDFNVFPVWQYVAGVLFNFLGIMFKLYPSAVINQTLHEIVKVSGEHCYPDVNVGETPKQRFIFYQFLFSREQDLGMHILGVKITSKLTVGIFVTIATVGLTFLHYVVPFLKRLDSL